MQELSLTVPYVEALLVTLILDGALQGRIDQQKMRFERTSAPSQTGLYNLSLDRWASRLDALNSALATSVRGSAKEVTLGRGFQ